MKQFIHRIYVVCLLAMLFIQVAAQRFVNVSFEGAQTVCAITQDAQGMMWVGTDNGLYSYDGYHVYLHYQVMPIAIRASMLSLSIIICCIWLLAMVS